MWKAISILAAQGLLSAACVSTDNVPCVDNSNCNRYPGGECRAAPSGDSWCVYPDDTCPSGERWSDLDVGDGLSGICVGDSGDEPDAAVADARMADAGPDAAGTTIDAAGSVDAPPPIVWGDTMLVANVNSTDSDMGPSLSADGLELYFSSNRAGSEGLSDIWVATRQTTSQAFGNPTQVAEVSSAQNELDPEISSDGKELYFYSALNGTMVATRSSPAASWSSPTALGFYAKSPAITGDGLALYYVRNGSVNCGTNGPCIKKRTRTSIGAPWSDAVDVPLPGGLQYSQVDISSDELGLLVSSPGIAGQQLAMQSWRSSTADDFETFEPIPALTYDVENGGAAWNKDETEIYLHSDRVQGVGSDDIYVSLPE